MESRRAGFQMSDTDSSDSEQLPVFDFSQKKSTEKPKSSPVDSDTLGSDMTPLVIPNASCPARGDVYMVSSDSEEEEVFVPLALRLKQKPNGLPSQIGTHEVRVSVNGNGNFNIHSVPAAAHRVLTNFHPDTDAISHHSTSYGPSRSVKEPVAVTEKCKRTPAEIGNSREEALRRKAEREKQQVEKERITAEKKVLVDTVKAMRPEECLKHMVVMVDPGLLQMEGGGELLTSLHAMGCSCAIEKQPLPRSVCWIRRTPCPQTGELLSIPDSHILIQVPVDDFINMVHCSTQEQKGGERKECGISLTAWIHRLMSRNSDRTLSLVVVDIEKYFKSQNSKSNQKFRDRVLNVAPQGGIKKKKKNEVELLPEVSRVEMEEALVDLQLHTGVQVHFHSTWKDFTNYVTMSTKAVAEAPFKRDREKTGFSFCLDGEWAGGQKVERTGKGLLQVWKRQIQQLNRVSADMATAILSRYPSPQLLTQAYKLCKSEREKVALLSDLLIRRGEGVTSTTRRIGPELSKRVFLLMNSSDPQQTIDSIV
ncbi:crossover junction endonuclease EME1 [Trichomycterus rosablanca]|uniref:crossover junction endonuclease EME1 n=1 Tax=Trichomycterus rosablanca TaxID=2290929 RepID=UPI002F35064D